MNRRVVPSTLKKAVNLSISAALIADAKANGVNLSATLERALAEDRSKRWLAENAEAIEAYNLNVEQRGVWSEGLRRW